MIPWGRGRTEKLPPRNSTVVIQKTKIRDLETMPETPSPRETDRGLRTSDKWSTGDPPEKGK